MRARPAVLAALALLASAATAGADAPPPPDWKDPCLAEHITEADDCRRCTAPEFKARACHEDAKRDGYALRCRGWSYAMYCRAGAAPSASASGASTAAPPSTATAVVPSGATAAPPSSAPSAAAPAPSAASPVEQNRSRCSCSLPAAGGDAGAVAALALGALLGGRRRRRHGATQLR